jgi:hypothetical protein
MFDALFSVANVLALIGWICLIVFPGRRIANRAAGLVIPALLAVAYAALIAAFWAGGEGGFSSLSEVRRLFGGDGLLLAGWLHYLAFDLFIGAWEVRTARAEGVPHILVVPCLVLTFLFGPIGLLAFLIIRQARSPRLVLEA